MVQLDGRQSDDGERDKARVTSCGTTQSTSPLIAAVCNRYSVRTSMMIGGASVFLGLLLTSVAATNFYFLFFSYSLLTGIGLGFATTSGIFMVSSYFEKRRGFALSLANAGGGAGTFIIVPLFNYLFEYYGFEGSFLIIAAIMSNVFLAAMLFRPISMYHKFSKLKENRVKKLLQQEKDDVNVNGDLSLSDNVSVKLGFLEKEKSDGDHRSRARQKNSFLGLKPWLKICFPTEHSRKGVQKKRKVFHFGLMKNQSFVLHMCSVTFFTTAMKATFTFIPAMCVDKGLTRADAALILSVVGGVETCGRVISGYILDMPKMKRFRPVLFCTYPYGVALGIFFLPFLESFMQFTIVCTLFGICFGAYITQRPIVIEDLYGKDFLPSCIGLVRLSQSVGMLAGPLLFGALRDATGDYRAAFFAGSFSMLMAAILMTLSLITWFVQHRKQNTQTGKIGE